MDFIEKLNQISAQIPKQIEHITTEEATKNAFVMPFINALGYNVFDPTEVVPEFTADHGTKKGEKVDYAIMKDGIPIMLFECKWCGSLLNNANASQLYRYFSVTEARIGILTNGVIFRFYSDLDESNKMDRKPFLEIDMMNLNEMLVPELKKLTKTRFDLGQIINTASELKYTKEVKKILTEQLNDPSDDFVRFCVSRVYEGRMTQTVKEQFRAVVKQAFHQFIRDRITDRLRSALDEEERIPEEPVIDNEEGEELTRENRIETTEEEIEAYHMVKAMLRESVDASRIAKRDTISYMGILLDDNNRKPLCRLYFNNPSKKKIAFLDAEKKEERIPIDNLDDIYHYQERLRLALNRYLQEEG